MALRSKAEPTQAELQAELERRRRASMRYQRVVSVFGLIGIGTALGAILGAVGSASWITGLIVSLVTIVLAAILWTIRF